MSWRAPVGSAKLVKRLHRFFDLMANRIWNATMLDDYLTAAPTIPHSLERFARRAIGTFTTASRGARSMPSFKGI
jgi:hypothetical protein